MTTPQIVPITSTFDPAAVLASPDERYNATGNRKLMLALTLSFPALDGYPYAAWDPTQFERWARETCSSSSWHAALFIMSVWNVHEARRMSAAPRTKQPWKNGRGFDVAEAMVKWDSGNRAAFLAWARDPWWA